MAIGKYAKKQLLNTRIRKNFLNKTKIVFLFPPVFDCGCQSAGSAIDPGIPTKKADRTSEISAQKSNTASRATRIRTGKRESKIKK
jgi:hypothetical protein